MKKTTIFLIAFFLQSYGFGQTEFAPPGAEWNYFYAGFIWGLGLGDAEAEYVGDTLVENKLCKKIHLKLQSNTNDNVWESDHFIYQSSDSIFRLNKYSSEVQFDFLFRNEFEVGEYVVFPEFYGDDSLVVELVDTVFFNNNAVERYHLAAIDSTFSTLFYDRMGPERGFFEWWFVGNVDGLYMYLQCYKDDEIGMVSLDTQYCIFIGPTAIFNEPIAPIELFPFPNPVADQLNLDLPSPAKNNASVLIYDIGGNVSTYDLLNGNFNVNNLLPGFYIGKIWVKEEFYFFKFIKQ